MSARARANRSKENRIMSIFCKHSWKVIEKTVLKSQAEVMKEAGLSPKSGFPSMFNQKVVIILQCEKCGSLKKFVEETSS